MEKIPFQQALSIWNNYATDAEIAKIIGTHRQTVSKWHGMVREPHRRPYMSKFWKHFYAEILPKHTMIQRTQQGMQHVVPKFIDDYLKDIEAGFVFGGMDWIKDRIAIFLNADSEEQQHIEEEEFWWKWMPYILGLETINGLDRFGVPRIIPIDHDWIMKMDMLDICLQNQDDDYIIRDLLMAACDETTIEEAYEMLMIRLA